MDPQIKELRSKAPLLKPLARIGKAGLNEGQLKELDKLLKKHKLVKVKLLKPFLEDKDKKDAAKELAEKTRSKIVQQVGFSVVIYRD